MISKEQIFERLAFSLKKSDVVQIAETMNSVDITPYELIDISIGSDESKAFHAAWVLENYFVVHTSALEFFLPNLIETIVLVKNESVQRHYCKLIAIGIKHLLSVKASNFKAKELWQMNLDPLQEQCFFWLVEPTTKPAVKVHCMDILFLLSSRYKWISEDLPAIIEAQMELGGPAIRAKGREIIKAIASKKHQPFN